MIHGYVCILLLTVLKQQFTVLFSSAQEQCYCKSFFLVTLSKKFRRKPTEVQLEKNKNSCDEKDLSAVSRNFLFFRLDNFKNC